MQSQQMRSDLIKMIKKAVNRLNISSETYYHSVLLFNFIRLKKLEENQPQYFPIPIKKRDINRSSENKSNYKSNFIPQPLTRQIKIHRSQMPEKDKLYFATCLFLAHKLYSSFNLRLSQLMRQLNIQEKFEHYVIQLELQFLRILSYRMQSMLPSNQTLEVCQLWDQFNKNISSQSVDIRFGIKELLSNQKQAKRQSKISKLKIQPEFKSSQNRQSLQVLCLNIQILVHNRALYEFYLRKSSKQNKQNLHPMKKIGLAITYVTILQQSRMIFRKKYPISQKQNPIPKNLDSQYLDFVFNDFLNSEFAINLKHLKEQIQFVREVLQSSKQKRQQISQNSNSRISSVKDLEKIRSNDLISFLLKGKEKPDHSYQYESKQNMIISKKKAEKQVQEKLCSQKKKKYIIQLNSIKHQKALQSNFHQQMLSQRVNSLTESFFIPKGEMKKQRDAGRLQRAKKKLMKKSSQRLEFSSFLIGKFK